MFADGTAPPYTLWLDPTGADRMTKMIRLTQIALALVVLLPALGCSYVKTPVVAFSDDGDYLPKDVGRGLVASPDSKIADVPMPIGFKPVGSKCSWGWDGRARKVHHVYQGHSKQGDVVEFYQRTLPGHGWTMVDMQSISDSTVMRYTKGVEQMAITSERGWGVATITIDIKAN